MPIKKEALEVKCGRCDTNFRLWIPTEILPEWDKGVEINCIKCGARFQIKRGDKGLEVTLIEEEKPAAAAAGAAEGGEAAEGGKGAERVLYVEDDKLATAVAQSTLGDMGVELIIVKTGREALQKLDNGKIDLLVTDLHLIIPDNPEADIDGEDLLKMVVEKGLNIPAIVTTGKDIVDDLILDPKWYDLHVKGFIQKGNPFWAEELKDKIKEVLNKQ